MSSSVSALERLILWEANLSSFKAPILEALRIALDRGQREGRFRADVDEKQLLISCLALSFFYFSNQYTLGRALGFDLAAPETIETRIGHVVSLLLDGIRVRNGQTAAALTG